MCKINKGWLIMMDATDEEIRLAEIELLKYKLELIRNKKYNVTNLKEEEKKTMEELNDRIRNGN